MNTGYAVALIISAIASAVVAVASWRRRAAPGATSLAVATGAMSVWAATYALRWLSADPGVATFWLDATYFGVVVVPAAIFTFALEFTSRSRLLTWRNLALIAVVPALTLIILWTDPLHGWFYGGHRTTGSILSGGPWFWVNAVYSYALLLVTLVLLAQSFVRTQALYRRQAGVALLGVSLPWLINIASLLGVSPVPDLDLTPMVFTATGWLIAFALFRYGMLDIVPMARDRLVEHMAEGVIVLDAHARIVDINPAAQELTGLTGDAIGRVACDALPDWCAHAEGHPVSEHAREATFEHVNDLVLEVRWAPLRDHGALTGNLITLRDITSRRRVEQALDRYRDDLERLTVTDELTGLANRRKAIQRLTEEFARFRRTGAPLAVMMLDLDHFKNVNDAHGHAVGDAVLVDIAERIRSTVRDYDLAARMGGEEFLVLAPSTDHDGAIGLAERIRLAIEQAPMAAGDTPLHVTASIGVTSAGPADDGIDPMLARADQALYEAKDAGRNAIRVR